MKVLLPVDGSPASDAAVDALIDQFDPATTEVCVLHIVDHSFSVNESLAFADSAAGAHIVADLLSEREHEGHQIAARAAARLRSVRFKTTADVCTGEPRGAVLAAADRWHADLIVMGSHGRSGLDRLLMGSVAEHVLRHAPCRVEIVRPAPAVAN